MREKGKWRGGKGARENEIEGVGKGGGGYRERQSERIEPDSRPVIYMYIICIYVCLPDDLNLGPRLD